MTAVFLIARKEAGELLLSIRGLSWLLVAAVALSAFGLLLVSDTELSLLESAEVVYYMTGIVTALGAMLALLVGMDTVAGERERGSLVPLLLTPLGRASILYGKLSGIALAWVVLFALSLPYLWAVDGNDQSFGKLVLTLAVFGTPLVLGFGFLGLGLGSSLPSRTAISIGLIILLLSASPLLLGPSLRQTSIGRAFDLLNPFSAAVNIYDAVIVDLQPLLAIPSGILTLAIWLALALALAHLRFRKVNVR